MTILTAIQSVCTKYTYKMLVQGDFSPFRVVNRARCGRSGYLGECHITTVGERDLVIVTCTELASFPHPLPLEACGGG